MVLPLSLIHIYLYNGPGYETYMKPAFPEAWKKADQAYCLSHCILSYIYDGCDRKSDAFLGLSKPMQELVIACTAVSYTHLYTEEWNDNISFIQPYGSTCPYTTLHIFVWGISGQASVGWSGTGACGNLDFKYTGARRQRESKQQDLACISPDIRRLCGYDV